MDKLDKLMILEKYVDFLDHDYQEVARMRKFLNIEDDDTNKMVDVSLKMIHDKIKKLKKCESIDDYSKYIDVKKVIKRYGDIYG